VADGTVTYPLITNSNAQNRFVVPVSGTISVMTVAWDSASLGFITIHKTSGGTTTTIYTTNGTTSFNTVGGGQTAITLAPLTVTAGQYIEVKANRGAGATDDSGESFGGLNAVLYFT
jgi:hypothetical protein